MMEGKTQQSAAASAAMSERSARKWQRGSLPSERKKDGRNWRTRPDPFAEVWESDVVPLLLSDPNVELSATTILEWIEERHPGRFGGSQPRTLQQRIRDHRALHGPDREVYFQQEHPPGREAQVDFTHCTELEVTIGGEPFRHLVFHLVLSHSGWSYAEVCFGETFAALVKGLQGALWELGGVPRVVRTDNLSVATHDLKNSRGRAMNPRYEAVLAHYGVEATRTNPRSSHENGVVEQGHRRLKNALDQALILRGSRDFESEEEYRTFVRGVVDRRNRLVRPKLRTERRHLRPLPPAPVPEYANYRCRVRRWSTIRVANRTYSVPSRLIGTVVDARVYADHIEVFYKERHPGDLDLKPGYRYSNAYHLIDGLNVWISQYLAPSSSQVGMYVVGQDAESPDAVRERLLPHEERIRDKLGIRTVIGPTNRHFAPKVMRDIDATDRDNWLRISDWFHENLLAYRRALSGPSE